MWDTFVIGKDDDLAILGAWWLGMAIRTRRVRLGVTQRRLADLTGVDQSMISRLENGRLKGIKHVRLLRIIGTLNGLDEYGPPPWFANPRRRRRPYVTLNDSGAIVLEEDDVRRFVDQDDDEDDHQDDPADPADPRA